MEFQYRKINIIIIARNYNPSIVSKDWVLDKALLTEPIDNFTHTPLFSFVENKSHSLIVDSDRLQISVKILSPENIEELPKIAKKFILALPETPYKMMGFNYTYQVKEENDSLRKLFSPNEKSLEQIFGFECQLGGTIVFKFKEIFHARVNISPIKTDEEKSRKIDFNFHTEIQDKKEILQGLNLYSETKKKAESIIIDL